MAHPFCCFQVDLDLLHRVTGVATQGADSSTDWVTSYKLQYSSDGSNWQYYSKVIESDVWVASYLYDLFDTFLYTLYLHQ